MNKKPDFGLMDIPLSCSMFLEPALNKYAGNIVPLSSNTKKFVHEWNIALMSVIKSPKYRRYLGDVGRKILSRTLESERFPIKCVDSAKSVPLHSLHYAIRFSESVRFLTNKITANKGIKFVDFGCGFSPLAPVIQSEYKISDSYCIDNKPEIIEVYSLVSEKVAGFSPKSISWQQAKNMALSGNLNTVIAMGVLPYIDIEGQVSCLKFINKNFPNFLIEIKYNNNSSTAGENVFDLNKLQKLKLDVENANTLETTMIRNSLRYLHRFIAAMPDKRYFLKNDRSLFLSR